MVNVIGLELMQDRNHYSAVCECCYAGGAPVGAVLAAQSNAVTGFQTGLFKEYVQLGNTAGYVAVEQGSTFIVCKCLKVPVAGYGTGYVSIQVLLGEDVVGSVVVIYHIMCCYLFRL